MSAHFFKLMQCTGTFKLAAGTEHAAAWHGHSGSGHQSNRPGRLPCQAGSQPVSQLEGASALHQLEKNGQTSQSPIICKCPLCLYQYVETHNTGIYIFILVYTYTCRYKQIHANTVFIHAKIDKHVSIFVCMCIYMHVCACIVG